MCVKSWFLKALFDLLGAWDLIVMVQAYRQFCIRKWLETKSSLSPFVNVQFALSLRMPGFYIIRISSLLAVPVILGENTTLSVETAALCRVYIPMSIAVTKAISSHILMTFSRKKCKVEFQRRYILLCFCSFCYWFALVIHRYNNTT